MSEYLFDAARRVETMIGREDALDQIKTAIYTGHDGCQMILITGPGGIGKSRLIEEVQARVGHPDFKGHKAAYQWAALGKVMVSDAIDLVDIRLTSRARLLQALRDALSYPGGMDFSRYDRALSDYQRTLEAGAGFTAVAEAEHTAEADFWRDYQQGAAERRVVLLLDTAERLVLDSSNWLRQYADVLTEDDWAISSDQWLLQQLQGGRFVNTTLLIAGREQEGERLFGKLSALNQQQGKPCAPIKVPLGAFNKAETEAYFSYLAQEWQERANRPDASGATRQTADTFTALTADTERLHTLHLLTGGRPVLLSLYSDLLNEPIEFPDPLRLSPSQMQEKLAADQLTGLQKAMGQSFIDALFQQPGRRAEIMQALARCPMGLDAGQLHFILDSNTKVRTSWQPTFREEEAIASDLEKISHLSIARPRPDGRMGLQDEIYRIYAERMADTDALRSYESEMRHQQYGKLVEWAAFELKDLYQRREELQLIDQQRLAQAVQTPQDALRIKPSSLTTAEQDDVDAVQQSIRDWELQWLHYQILLDPEHGFNNAYTDLVESSWRANNAQGDVVTQQEMWRALHDPHAMHFSPVQENRLGALRRAASEEDAARWIKRLILRREFSRAITLYHAIEEAVGRLNDPGTRMDHPFNAYERQIWYDYARIMRGPDAEFATKGLRDALACLVQLAKTDDDVSCGKAQGTKGYKSHSALPRLQRLIAVGYNFLGYGEVVRGQYRQAVEDYGKALLYLRAAPMEAQHAATLNNLARALASLGREERGERICQDALNLRRRLGAEIPIAYSLNTLALIKNGRERTPTAWRLATQALALFRRAGDERGQGLALTQLGIGLRRLANTEEAGNLLETDVEALYDASEAALREAVDIFDGDSEIIREVEARLEFGCLLRDRLRSRRISSNKQRRDRLARDAEIQLSKAITLAEKRFPFLALQARVDLAWLRFYADDYSHDKAGEATDKAERSVLQGYRVADDPQIKPEEAETHYYYQLAKIAGLRAAIATRQFEECRAQLRQQYVGLSNPDFYQCLETDENAKKFLSQAAESYVLSLYYGQMFSQRSRSLVVTYDQIYGHVKHFNGTEYRMFYRFQHEAAEKYKGKLQAISSDKDHKSQSTPYDFSRLEGWLNDCFGPVE
ncbi:MAG: tetratricopeptide repeat protein [Caldilineales bacterium]